MKEFEIEPLREFCLRDLECAPFVASGGREYRSVSTPCVLELVDEIMALRARVGALEEAIRREADWHNEMASSPGDESGELGVTAMHHERRDVLMFTLTTPSPTGEKGTR